MVPASKLEIVFEQDQLKKEGYAARHEWVAVARLLRPQGRRGELLAEPLTDVPELLAAGVRAQLGQPNAALPESAAEPVTIDTCWRPTGKNAGRVVLKLHGCDDISAAEAMAGKQLMLPTSALPALEPDTFYVRDLLGCALWDGDTRAGEIVDVQFVTSTDGRVRLNDAAPLLEVRPGGAGLDETVLVPFVRSYLDHVDISARRVSMHLPEGFFSGEAELPDDSSDES